MKSPFPGMDPYLESPAIWAGFHNEFMTYLKAAIVAVLPDHYDARLETQLRLVDAPPIEAGDYQPDLSVTRRTDDLKPSFGAADAALAVLDPPEILPIGDPIMEQVREAHIDIYRWPGEELITSVELLSPWNKRGEGLGEFQRKRRAMLLSPVNWVEIDLLIGGERIAFGRSPKVETDYQVVIARTTMRPNAERYGWNLRDPLPAIPIPLREPDPAIPISLADVFATTYDRGRLDKSLRRMPPGLPRPLRRHNDRQWAADLAQTR